MTDSELLKSFVDQYQLEVDGVKFWTPYFINSKELSPDPENFKPGPFKGKGTPAQIHSWLKIYAKRHPGKRSASQWREVLLQNGVGIECSGFVYYVLDSFLWAKGIGRLWDHIFIPRADILKGFKEGRRAKGVSEQDILSYPEQVRLSDFCRQWGKDPRRNTNVARLVSPAATVGIESANQLKPGDLVDLRGPDGDHVGIILKSHEGFIEYADSLGYKLWGVTKHTIQITNHGRGLEEQSWGESEWYKDRYEFRGLRRLKVLDGRTEN